MKKELLLLGVLCLMSTTIYAQNGNVGINTVTPGTTLDVNGAITNRETAVVVSGNAATVPANISQVQLTGAATAAVAITAPAAPNAGQRLIIYNNTTGGFAATLNGFSIANGQAMEFAYSNGGWRATNGGAAPSGTAWNLLGNAGTTPSTNFLGTTDNQDMVIRTNNTEKMRVQSGGNVGIGTAAPATTLNVVNTGTGGASVGTGGTANTALRLENSGNGQAVIQNLSAKNASGTTVSTALGVNPNFGTNGIFLISKSNTSDFLMDLGTGNIGLNTVPTAKLHINGTFRLVDGTQGSGKILMSDANGNASWQANEVPIVVLKPTAIQTVLSGVGAGNSTTLTNWATEVNTIPGSTFSGSNLTLPVGTYEVAVVFEMAGANGTCPAAGFLINSYFVDLPNNGGAVRIHSNSPSNCGSATNHSALWRTTVTIPAGGQSTTIHIGRGQGGNYQNFVDTQLSSRIIYKKVF